MRSDQSTGNSAYTADKLAACVGSELNWIPCSYIQTPFFFYLFIYFFFLVTQDWLLPFSTVGDIISRYAAMQLWAAYLLSMLHTLQETNHKLDMNQWLYFLGRVAVYLFSSQLIIHFVRECTCNPSITVSAYPYHLQRGLAAARLLGLRVQIPPGAWTSVSLECCMLYRQRSLRRADPSSRGVLPSVYASHWMWSGETITFYSYNERLGRQRSDCMYVHTHTHTHTYTYTQLIPINMSDVSLPPVSKIISR